MQVEHEFGAQDVAPFGAARVADPQTDQEDRQDGEQKVHHHPAPQPFGTAWGALQQALVRSAVTGRHPVRPPRSWAHLCDNRNEKSPGWRTYFRQLPKQYRSWRIRVADDRRVAVVHDAEARYFWIAPRWSWKLVYVFSTGNTTLFFRFFFFSVILTTL